MQNKLEAQPQNAALLAGYPSRFHSQAGTVPYLAPELLEVDAQGWPTGNPTRAAHHQAADIWAAACTAFRILTNQYLVIADPSQALPDQKMLVRRQHSVLVRLHYIARHCTALHCLLLSVLATEPGAGLGASCRHFGVQCRCT